MYKIAAVKTLNSNKALWFDAGELEAQVGDKLVVETARGLEFGTLQKEIFEVDDKEIEKLKSDLQPVKRIATKQDIDRAEQMIKKGEDALPSFIEIASETNKDMRPISVEYLLDGKKAVFYFSAPERQDFRDLVKKLSSKFKVRVDMRQINEREKSSRVGGIGICGQELCCALIGRCPNHVSIKQAKSQGMSLNPDSISGMCGKLLCCLDYEYEEYKEFNNRSPKLKAKIMTPEGIALVTDLNMPHEYVEVQLQDNEKRVKIPLAHFSYSEAFAKEVSANLDNPKPNKIDKDAWEKANEDNNIYSLNSVYTSTNLKGSEKLASGIVTKLPSVNKKQERNNSTTRQNSTNNRRKRRSHTNKTYNNKNHTTTNEKKKNLYESSNKATIKRRSRTLGSKFKPEIRPGQKSSGLSN